MKNPRSFLPIVGVAVAVVVAVATAFALGMFSSDSGASHPNAVWRMYMGDLGRTGFAARETSISTSNVHSLRQRWLVPGKASISDQATSAGGLLYWGSWDGYEHASKPATGQEVWRSYIGQETKHDCVPQHIGVGSSATISSIQLGGRPVPVLFVGGGDGSVYALRAATGKIVWSRNFGSPKNGWFIWSSPAVFRGSVYVGVASIGACPLVRGAVVKLDAATGGVQARFDTVGKGCIGGSVWGSPAIDVSAETVYATTGNSGGACTDHEPHAESVLELSAHDLTLQGSWRTPIGQRVPDGDFGSSPTLFTARIGGKPTKLVGAVNKNGIYYAFRRGDLGAGPVWQTTRLSPVIGTIASSAWDGSRLYVAGGATRLDGKRCEASVRAVDPATGKYVWQACVRGGMTNAALTAVPGLVFESAGPIFYAFRASDGKELFNFQDEASDWIYSPATVVGGTVYIGSSGGNLYALAPRGS
jgi:outer membrane protein assembly factor BamB